MARQNRKSGLLIALAIICAADFVAGFVYGFGLDTRKSPATPQAYDNKALQPESRIPPPPHNGAQAPQPKTVPLDAMIDVDNPEKVPLSESPDGTLLGLNKDAAKPSTGTHPDVFNLGPTPEPKKDLAATDASASDKEKTNYGVVVERNPIDGSIIAKNPDEKNINTKPDPKSPTVKKDPEGDLYRFEDQTDDKPDNLSDDVKNADALLEQGKDLLRKWNQGRARQDILLAKKVLDEAKTLYRKALKAQPKDAYVARQLDLANRLHYAAIKNSPF